jgi:hypothetical protein
MQRAYWVLWTQERLKAAEEDGCLGRPLPALYGGPHISHPSLMSHKVSAGDVVYPICVAQGRLLILCRVKVDEVVALVEFERRRAAGLIPAAPTPSWLRPTCTDDAAVVRHCTPLRADCAVPPELLESIRLVNPKGEERPLKKVRDGRLTHTAGIDGHYYRLSDATRAMFDGVISSLEEQRDTSVEDQ